MSELGVEMGEVLAPSKLEDIKNDLNTQGIEVHSVHRLTSQEALLQRDYSYRLFAGENVPGQQRLPLSREWKK